jgi:hypothetical protein
MQNKHEKNIPRKNFSEQLYQNEFKIKIQHFGRWFLVAPHNLKKIRVTSI